MPLAEDEDIAGGQGGGTDAGPVGADHDVEVAVEGGPAGLARSGGRLQAAQDGRAGAELDGGGIGAHPGPLAAAVGRGHGDGRPDQRIEPGHGHRVADDHPAQAVADQVHPGGAGLGGQGVDQAAAGAGPGRGCRCWRRRTPWSHGVKPARCSARSTRNQLRLGSAVAVHQHDGRGEAEAVAAGPAVVTAGRRCGARGRPAVTGPRAPGVTVAPCRVVVSPECSITASFG